MLLCLLNKRNLQLEAARSSKDESFDPDASLTREDRVLTEQHIEEWV